MRIAFVLCVFLVSAACKKSKQDVQTENTLAGNWKAVKSWGSPGDATIYVHDISDRNYYVRFQENGILVSNFDNLKQYSFYAQGENNSLKISGNGVNSRIWYSFNQDTLKLAFECIEGCGIHLIRNK